MVTTTATVEVLTAEVRTLMVGSRQVTLSVYRQLDGVGGVGWEWMKDFEPFGRVHDSKDESEFMPGVLFLIGRHRETGALVRAWLVPPGTDDWVERAPEGFVHWLLHVKTSSLKLSTAEYTMPSEDISTFMKRKQVRVAGEKSSRLWWEIDRTYMTTELCGRDCDLDVEAEEEGWRNAALAQHAALMRERSALQRCYDEWSALPLIVLAGLR
jgi:hypothetical protein